MNIYIFSAAINSNDKMMGFVDICYDFITRRKKIRDDVITITASYSYQKKSGVVTDSLHLMFL